MHELLPLLAKHAEGVSFVKVATQLGRAVRDEINTRRLDQDFHEDARLRFLDMRNVNAEVKRRIRYIANDLLNEDTWTTQDYVKVGGLLIEAFMDATKITSESGADASAIIHTLEVSENKAKSTGTVRKTVGWLKLNPVLRGVFLNSRDFGFRSNLDPLPMVVPPMPWRKPRKGAYFSLE